MYKLQNLTKMRRTTMCGSTNVYDQNFYNDDLDDKLYLKN